MPVKKHPDQPGTSPPSSANTRIWDALGKTDPAQTKPFTKGGGFRGTATKPIWLDKRMTEEFGPCGIGWGTMEPVFHVYPAGEEMMVFAHVGLWYIDPSSGTRSDPVWGVGGDRFLLKEQKGPRTSDEAFKMAHTDAIGNAMKLIGVCADIHLGMFEDSKYVAEMRQAFSEQPVQQSVPSAHATSPLSRSELYTSGDAYVDGQRIQQAIEGAKTMSDLQGIWTRNKDVIDRMKSVAIEHFNATVAAKEKRKSQLTTNEKAA